jgi:RNA polymerase sigma-70 factor (ECF subfamily)
MSPARNNVRATTLFQQDRPKETWVAEDIRTELVALLPRLRRFAYGLTGSLDEGDDVVQSACERALNRLDQFKRGTRLDSWMYRIVQTVWIDRLRSRKTRNEQGMDPVDLEPLATVDAVREMTARLELAEVRHHVARLPDDQRAVLLLTAVEGLSYKEAAETLNLPMGTVMSRLARARLALGKALESPAPMSARTA